MDYIPTFTNSLDIEEEFPTFNEAFPDGFDTFKTMANNTGLSDSTLWDTSGFLAYVFNALEAQYGTSYLAYTTTAAFNKRFTQTLQEWLSWGFKGFQIFAFGYTGTNTIDELLKSLKESRTIDKDATRSMTGNDTLTRTGTDQSERDMSGSTFSKGADTPTNTATTTDFSDEFTNNQTKITDTQSSTDTLTRNTVDTAEREGNDTLEEATSEGREVSVSFWQLLDEFNKAKPTILWALLEALDKHFIGLFQV